ncbi:MAG: hypothetical protein WBW31_23030 [Candidatus Sulfotelmatobacter sp.]
MDTSRIFSFRYLRLGLIGVLIAGGVCSTTLWHGHAAVTAAPAQFIPPLSANDVSLLFPAPTKAEDFAKLIAVRDLTTPNPQDPTKRDLVWPYAVFQRFIEIANGPAAQVAGTQNRIGLPAEAQSIDAWFIAGIRIDAGAPGLSNEIRAQFGQLPEIRLIIQPVTRNPDGTPNVLDIAGHLIFDFNSPTNPAQAGCLPRRLPDLATFNTIISDLATLRTKLGSGQLGAHKVTTSGVPLGVHPGLADTTTESNFRQEIKSFLEKYISSDHLDAMAVAGLPAGAHEPWIFLSMAEVPPGFDPDCPKGGFCAVHGPTLDGKQFAQMLEPEETVPRVVPEPHTNNLNQITCKNAAAPASPPIADRSGVSTADLFINPPPPVDKAKQILDVIADPSKSHFFNTDCVSCHTETQLSIKLLNTKNIPGIDPAVLPLGPWDVRNFGWAPPPGKGAFHAEVTRRAAAETTAVVTFINSEVLAKQGVPSH